MKKLLKNPSGFTLVELMVVVAIIGILSAIAVPNFKKYQAKSKQSEAKIQLAAIYNSEVGTQADYDTYATCLSRMGYEQSPRGYYLVGFGAGYNASGKFPLCTGNTVNTTPNVAALDDRVIAPISHLAALTANRPAAITTTLTTASQIAFKAAAEGSISATLVDRWSIDQTKKLTLEAQGF